MPKTLDEVTIQSEIVDPDPQPPLIIDKFPFGHPGMPIEGPDSSSGNPNQVDPHGPLWAPFCSELDWKFAQWAKLRGPSSSVLDKLLCLPEVCHLCPYLFSLLN
jgi:hypothetical protein